MRRRILLVAPVPTHPSATGASARVRHMAAALEGLGHEVQFLHLQQPFRMDDGPLRKAWGDRLHVCRSLTPRSFIGRGRRKLVRVVGATLQVDADVKPLDEISPWPVRTASLRLDHLTRRDLALIGVADGAELNVPVSLAVDAKSREKRLDADVKLRGTLAGLLMLKSLEAEIRQFLRDTQPPSGLPAPVSPYQRS